MALKDGEMKALKPYEKNMETALRANWASYPGAAALELMHAIVARETGRRARLNKSCSACVLALLRDAGGSISPARRKKTERNEYEVHG